MRSFSTFLLLALFLSLPLPSSAQAPPDTTDIPEGMVFVAAGGASASVSSLNRFLAAFELPTFTSNVPSVGGGGYVTLGEHVMLGAEGHYYRWGRGSTTPNQDVTIRGAYGLLTGGYSIRPLPNRLPTFRVYPMVGVGGGTFRLKLSGTGETFQDILRSPDRGVTLARQSLLVSAKVGAEYQFLQDTNAHFRLGLHVGYLTAPLATDWRMGNDMVTGGPDAGLNGPFVRLVIGRGP